MTQQTCKNCGHLFVGKFCNQCGEKLYTDKDRSVLHVLGEGFHFITHFEGTFFNTVKVLFTKPGQLSLDYCNGIRKKYFKPISLFLLLVILYLLFPVFEGLNMKLKYYEMHGVYGKYAQQEVARVMTEKNIPRADLENSFHRAGEKISKFLLFILIPTVALSSWLAGFRKRKYYFDHFIFTIEMNSFFLLWGFLILPLLLYGLNSLFSTTLITSEGQTVFVILGIFFIYLLFAAKRFFRFKWWYAILYAFLFCISLTMAIEYVYKFILFLIAMRIS